VIRCAGKIQIRISFCQDPAGRTTLGLNNNAILPSWQLAVSTPNAIEEGANDLSREYRCLLGHATPSQVHVRRTVYDRKPFATSRHVQEWLGACLPGPASKFVVPRARNHQHRALDPSPRIIREN
jgi:hypothetical protein